MSCRTRHDLPRRASREQSYFTASRKKTVSSVFRSRGTANVDRITGRALPSAETNVRATRVKSNDCASSPHVKIHFPGRKFMPPKIRGRVSIFSLCIFCTFFQRFFPPRRQYPVTVEKIWALEPSRLDRPLQPSSLRETHFGYDSLSETNRSNGQCDCLLHLARFWLFNFFFFGSASCTRTPRKIIYLTVTPQINII